FEQQANPAPGDAFAGQQPVYPPPVSEYLGQQSTGPQYVGRPMPATAVATSRGARNASVAAGLSWGTLAMGFLIIVTTFLPWMTTGIAYWSKPSGWTFLAKGGAMGGNFIWLKIPGFLYFSGLWSILAGLAVGAGAVMLLKGLPQGRLVAGIGAVVGVGAATVNIVMTYNYQAGVGIGLWFFGIFSILAVVGAEFAFRYST
ncbi:MAG: hypothetical protein ACYC99_10435, partial [Candidatus Geothermincolia bacterium]